MYSAVITSNKSSRTVKMANTRSRKLYCAFSAILTVEAFSGDHVHRGNYNSTFASKDKNFLFDFADFVFFSLN